MRQPLSNSTEMASMPYVSIGYLLVLDVRPDTATAVVIDAREEIGCGAYVRSVEWEKALSVCSALPECSER